MQSKKSEFNQEDDFFFLKTLQKIIKKERIQKSFDFLEMDGALSFLVMYKISIIITRSNPSRNEGNFYKKKYTIL